MTNADAHCNRKRMSILAALPAALVIACASQPPQPPQRAQLARAVAPPQRTGPPSAPLSGTARSILRIRMGSHARDMGELVSAIMVLEYPRIHERAAAISSDASLARPISGDATELASALPATFFDLQDELRAQARTLGDAAEEQNPFHVANAYGRLSETCVRCHATYR